MATINTNVPHLLQVWLLIIMVINSTASSGPYHKTNQRGRYLFFPKKRVVIVVWVGYGGEGGEKGRLKN